MGGTTAYSQSYTATYDANGSVASETDPLGVTTTLTRDENGQLVSLAGVQASLPWYDDTTIPSTNGQWLQRPTLVT